MDPKVRVLPFILILILITLYAMIYPRVLYDYMLYINSFFANCIQPQILLLHTPRLDPSLQFLPIPL